LLKPANLECSIFMMSRIYDVSMVSLGVACLKRRLGGSALAATLARRMTRGSSAASLRAFSEASSRLAFDAIMRRVFGRRGSEVIAHSARTELGRMIFQRPVCKYMRSLQVMRLLCSLLARITQVRFCRRRRDGALIVTGHLLKLRQQLGRDLSQQMLSKPASAPQLKICTLMSLSCAV
jgi:hypothetical protein